MRLDAFRWSVPVVSAFALALLLGGTASAQEDDSGSEAAPESQEPSGAAAEDESSSESSKKEPGDDSGEHAESSAEKSVDEHVAVDLGASGQERFARVWIGVAGSLDVAFTGSGNDVCRLDAVGNPANSQGMRCTTPHNEDFPARANPMQNAALVPGQAGSLDGGPKVGDVRFLVAADYAVTSAILVGLRAGYVFNTYMGSGRSDFLQRLHLEARGTYVFGQNPLATVGFAPIAFVGAGIAATDAHAATGVSMFGVRGKTPADAWQLGGPGFVSLGGGARYTFSPRTAFTLAWKASLAFGSPSSLITTAPEVAFQYGF